MARISFFRCQCYNSHFQKKKKKKLLLCFQMFVHCCWPAPIRQWTHKIHKQLNISFKPKESLKKGLTETVGSSPGIWSTRSLTEGDGEARKRAPRSVLAMHSIGLSVEFRFHNKHERRSPPGEHGQTGASLKSLFVHVTTMFVHTRRPDPKNACCKIWGFRGSCEDSTEVPEYLRPKTGFRCLSKSTRKQYSSTNISVSCGVS